jgi:hypothetical protein
VSSSRPPAVSRWALAVVPTVLLPLLLLVVHNHRYLFYGDTQAAYLGWQYHLGEQLRLGHWPLLDPHAWQAGNFVAEGQAGLYSPLTMAVGLLSTVVGNVLVFTALTKIVLACAGSLGVYALARSYGAAGPLAYVAAVAAPLGGMTQYLDLPTWLAGLTIWALLPWAWWALRRSMRAERAGPFPALALGYLLVTVGYVYGTIMLIVVLGACLLDCALTRNRRGALRVFGVGVLCGLVAVAVYLPGVLTSPVTIRGSGIALRGKFDSDPVALFTSLLPTTAVPGTTLHVLPYDYAVWFLPVLLWLDPGRLRRGWRPVAGLVTVTVLVALEVVGPAQVGPLRWPLRLQPFLVMGLVVLCAVCLSRYAVRRPSRGRLLASLLWVALAGVLALARFSAGATGIAVGAVLVAAGLAALWLVARLPGRRTEAGAAVAVAFTLGLTVLQHAYFPVPPSPERHLPAHAADYRTQLRTARGDVMVLGNVASLVQSDPSSVSDLLDGSAWYLNPHRVQNTYTTIGFRRFRDRYPYEYDGSVRTGVLDTLFTREPTTGRLRVDLLSVSTLVLVRADFPARRLGRPPPGWQVTASTRYAVTWVRRRPVPAAGAPVWTSAGTSVSPVSVSDRATRFAVHSVPPGGGRVVLSALAWPGYRTDTGSLGPPVDGYLVSVDLPADASGRTVTVRFSPPGWPVEVAAWWLAVAVGFGWCVLAGRPPITRGCRMFGAPHGP